ncbi:MAG: murein biosynthesis integral membrane protein MurJ [Gemmatimonadota bacterium]|nr:murein biosynthesis integral membrane protein MurJ [Gemmatimonadota bacterium]
MTVAAGILFSRILGLVRNRVFAHYFGTSDAADAFNAAFRIPNLLQNLFGEGVLSASFIPVYAGLRARGEAAEARRVASAVAAFLALVSAILVLVGVVLTPWLIAAIAPGFTGEKREATIRLVRILFPGAGLLVLSAWCLGVLNSHRRFWLSYSAPVLWNLAIIAALLAFGQGTEQYRLAEVAAWGSVAGSLLQLGVQLPAVERLLEGAWPRIVRGSANVREVFRNFGPVFVGRGVVQISAYVDTVIASLLPTGAVAGIAYAQVLYTLPVSLFGISVSAAELPAMSGAVGTDAERRAYLRGRLGAGLRQIAFFVVPSAVAFVALGDVVVGALYQSGAFTRAMTIYVWAILAGSAVGLLTSTMGRLYSSTYYALRDTRTPLRFALVRVALTIGLGYLFALPLPRALGIEARWGAAGITLAAGIAGWVEFVLLRRGLVQRIGDTRMPLPLVARLWGTAALSAAVAWGLGAALPQLHPVAAAVALLGVYGTLYIAAANLLGVPEAAAVLSRIRPREPGGGAAG